VPDFYGVGILVPDEKVKKLEDQTHIYIVRDLLNAAEFIVAREKRSSPSIQD
jgi:hypothetical protein